MSKKLDDIRASAHAPEVFELCNYVEMLEKRLDKMQTDLAQFAFAMGQITGISAVQTMDTVEEGAVVTGIKL